MSSSLWRIISKCYHKITLLSSFHLNGYTLFGILLPTHSKDKTTSNNIMDSTSGRNSPQLSFEWSRLGLTKDSIVRSLLHDSRFVRETKYLISKTVALHLRHTFW